ncbi:MAG: Mur ligase family protein [Hyphomicrobiaceae bacterium]
MRRRLKKYFDTQSKKIQLAWRRRILLPLRRRRYEALPTAMITGTSGKTTTSRMLAHILKQSGFTVGLATTDNVDIAGRLIKEGDWAGYWGHHSVLNNPSISAAVLETARGGLLTDGLYIDRCHVAALLNVGREQIGIDGIDTIEDMAAVKRQVIEAAQRAVVLNADDPFCCRLIDQFPIDRTSIFSFFPDSDPVKLQVSAGGVAFCLDESGPPLIVRMRGGERRPVVPVANLPSTFGGVVRHNIANAMAAAAMAEGLGVEQKAVVAGLTSFHSSLERQLGRFTIVEGYSLTLILDMAVTIPSAMALVDSLERVQVSGRRICMCTTAGNRQAWHFQDYAKTIAKHFDHFVCYEHGKYRRGRAPGEINNLLKSGLLASGVKSTAIELAGDYERGLKSTASIAEAGDLIVLLCSLEGSTIPLIERAFARHATTRTGRCSLRDPNKDPPTPETVS